MIDSVFPTDKKVSIPPSEATYLAQYYPDSFDPNITAPSFHINGEKPVLEPPGPLSELSFGAKVCALVETLYKINANYSHATQLQIMTTEAAHSKDLESKRHGERAIEKKMESGTWSSYVARVAQCLLGASSLVAGTTLLSDASKMGQIGSAATLLASGGASIYGAINYNSESALSTPLALASAAVSFLGTSSFATITTQTSSQFIGKIATASLGLVGRFAGMTRSSIDAQLKELGANLERVNSSFEQHEYNLQHWEKDLEFFIDHVLQMIDTLSMILHKHEQSIRLNNIQGVA